MGIDYDYVHKWLATHHPAPTVPPLPSSGHPYPSTSPLPVAPHPPPVATQLEPCVMEEVGPPGPESEIATHIDVVEAPPSLGEASIHAASSLDSQLTEREEGASQKEGGVNQPQTPPRNPMKCS